MELSSLRVQFEESIKMSYQREDKKIKPLAKAYPLEDNRHINMKSTKYAFPKGLTTYVNSLENIFPL